MINDERQKALEDLLSRASDLPEGRTDYANIVHMNVSGNDVVLDFFLVTPNTKPNTHEPQVKHVQRIILPVGAAKEAGDILVQGTERWGDAFGVKLPFTPVDPDSDTTE